MSASPPTATPSPPVLTPKRAAVAALILLAVLTLLLALSPAEARLGNLIKIIYLHGALARVGLTALMAAGVLGLLWLVSPGSSLLNWSNAVQAAGLIVFAAHFVLSVVPTRVTWGMWIAFDEPRTRMSLQIIGVGLVVVVLRRVVDDGRFSALANLLLGIAVLLLNLRTGVLRHPINPISDSSSATIQLFYLAILLTCAALTGLLATWLARKPGASGSTP